MKQLTLALILGTLTVFAATTTETRHSFKLGAGFTGNTSGFGLVVNLASPSLVSFKFDEMKRRTDLHVFVEGGYLETSNFYQSAGTFTSVTNPLLTVGLLGQIMPNEGVFSPYTKIGMDILFPDSRLTAKNPSLGLRVAFGCDLFFAREEKSFLGTSDSSFFVEGALIFLHQRATLIAGSPILLEGFLPRVGFRSHF